MAGKCIMQLDIYSKYEPFVPNHGYKKDEKGSYGPIYGRTDGAAAHIQIIDNWSMACCFIFLPASSILTACSRKQEIKLSNLFLHCIKSANLKIDIDSFIFIFVIHCKV